MILDVRTDGWLPADIPDRFEAGTPPIAEAVGLAAAIRYLEDLGMEALREHEVSLTGHALRTLTERLGDRLTLFGPSEPSARGGVLSFELEGVHPHDVAQVLDQHGVAVRAGHHCAKPLMRVLGVNATARASLYAYNDTDDVDTLATALEAASDFFAI
jgi:cysteine desulfurase/selenocysteine lyase